MNIIDALKHITISLGVVSAIGGAYAGADAMGLDIPRVAWNTEVEEVKFQLVGLDVRTQTLIVEQIQRQVWAIEDRIEKRGSNQSSRDRLRNLKAQLEEANSRLKKIRGY
jgi:hypothetical protein